MPVQIPFSGFYQSVHAMIIEDSAWTEELAAYAEGRNPEEE